MNVNHTGFSWLYLDIFTVSCDAIITHCDEIPIQYIRTNNVNMLPQVYSGYHKAKTNLQYVLLALNPTCFVVWVGLVVVHKRLLM